MTTSQGRHIVLTGASRGLGLAMTEGFIEAGHIVWGCARSQQAVGRLAKRFGAPHRFSAVDVADDAQVKRWAGAVRKALGHVDLLINNAALMNRTAPLWEISTKEFSEIVDVNIKGVANMIRHFVPAMIEHGGGVIVNFSSGWGRSTSPEVAPYCATKWAIEGLSQALAQELPAPLAAVALNPGVIDTDMLRSCWGESAGDYQDPAEWARRAVPLILKITRQDNGKPLTVRSS